jgi:hypothetical protein
MKTLKIARDRPSSEQNAICSSARNGSHTACMLPGKTVQFYGKDIVRAKSCLTVVLEAVANYTAMQTYQYSLDFSFPDFSVDINNC